MFRAPELLVEGTALLSEAESDRLLAAGAQEGTWYQLQRFVELEGVEGAAQKTRDVRAPFTCFSAAPGRTGAVRLRVRWSPVEDPEAATAGGGGLGEVYFSAEIALLMGERDLGIDEAEAWLQTSTTPLLHAGGTCVYRSSLESAVALARARLAVLRSLETGGRGVRHRAVIDLEDAWATETDAPESVFAERWQAFLDRIAGGGGVPAIDAPPGFAGELRPYQARGVSWLAFPSRGTGCRRGTASPRRRHGARQDGAGAGAPVCARRGQDGGGSPAPEPRRLPHLGRHQLGARGGPLRARAPRPRLGTRGEAGARSSTASRPAPRAA